MNDSPYPGYPPSYRVVTTIGGYSRSCYALEVRALDKLSPTQLVSLQEQLEAAIASVVRRFPEVESAELIPSRRFDKMLLDGFRLPP